MGTEGATMTYKFNYEAMSIGDVMAFLSDDFGLKIIAINRLTEGGIMHLNAAELQRVIDAFMVGYKAYITRLGDEYAKRHTLKDALANAKVVEG